MSNCVFFSRLDTTIGKIWCASHQERLIRIALPGEQDRFFFGWVQSRLPEARLVDGRSEVAERLGAQIASYLQGKLKRFDLPVELQGTKFQKDVWSELVKIPYGQVISYGELARRLGRPQSSRAVGAANGANPLPIIIPCHRVIGSNGKLVGYGGGLETKVFLLQLEKGQHPLPFRHVPTWAPNG